VGIVRGKGDMFARDPAGQNSTARSSLLFGTISHDVSKSLLS